MTLRDLVPTFGRRTVPVRYNREDPFHLLHPDMDRLINEFFHGSDLDFFGGRAHSFSPRIEVTENEKEIRVLAELPGLDEKDINLSITDNELTISGEKKEENESKGKDHFIRERSYGSFNRMIPLYSEVDAEKAEAHFKKGLLSIKLPKTVKEVEAKKKINIKAG
jgi:HSP20 family protein